MFNKARIGHKILNAMEHSRGSLVLMIDAFMRIHALTIPPVRTILYRQIYFSGIQALSVVAFIGAMIGIVIMIETINIAGANSTLPCKILVWIVVRELGPMLLAIMVIVRSATAVAAELGSMSVGREMDYLRAMGIDIRQYIVMPRIVALTLSVVVLTFYFQLFAIGGGLLFSTVYLNVSFSRQIDDVFYTLGFVDMAVSILKSVVFGLIIAASSCYHGLRVRHSITEVPQVTSLAVMQSFVLMVLFDGVITVVSFL